jgi:phage gp46-like protein
MDIASKFDPIAVRADFALVRGALQADSDLQTAVLISLFTDRLAEPDDVLPEAEAPRRGWWGDALAARDGSGVGRIGSRLWLLSREKMLPETINRAREYTQEALAWLVTQGVARRVTVQAQVAGAGVLGLGIEIERNQGPAVRYRFELAWQQLRS